MNTVTIDGYLYDFSKYNHPGDGICCIYLKNYKRKDVSKEFNYYHFSDSPFEILEKAKQNWKDNKLGTSTSCKKSEKGLICLGHVKNKE